MYWPSFKPILENQHVALQMELSDGLSDITADRVQLKQVLLNLCNNAVEAMGSVAGRARVLSVKSQILDPDNILILVGDSGEGIEPKNLGRIFDALFTTKVRGMGMGLAISGAIIEAPVVRVCAYPRQLDRYVFYLTLPTPGGV